MTPDAAPVATSLNRYFLLHFPAEAARQIESFSAAEVLPSLMEQSVEVLVPVWSKLVPLVAATLTRQLPGEMAQRLLSAGSDLPTLMMAASFHRGTNQPGM